MNNIAELTSYNLDEQKTIWDNWEHPFIINPEYEWRTYVQLDYFNLYFKSMLQCIIELVGVPYKNILIQYYNKFNHDKWDLNIAHQDADRLSCITVPITEVKEPICFYSYDDVKNIQRGSKKLPKPIQMSFYSKSHPMLVNVNNFHNVRVVDETLPRILLQISYDVPFDQIINHNNNQWLTY